MAETGPLIDAAALKSKLDSGEGVLIVDVRRPDEIEKFGAIEVDSRVNIRIDEIEEGDGIARIKKMVEDPDSEHYKKAVVAH
mmetsp:Transcript_25430/g.35210  ORF Transcript_25430/g.35210 Transcript_25430/m.35210 type:complete len:82 (-) Transcript_25430:166-411(-)|eukprot:CAMPEP_0201482282 /NCGR_PEP_ID=MMETSP0151_2-20130828/6580_1 /ASSEMBLY_ACC=CAM_ASM_000257 /TAXON_ID=200890 /ORGANISM="Paramoeba atlantica, Strain 621/1 / CCAP 1560/9" /LENGTH=81 /DNA_ID=CAMNT_0047864921 /DNA_START=84 /DNA_END=329 /DNA_ORIENTATION=-